MGWFKKEKEVIEQAPILPELPEFDNNLISPSKNNMLPELPELETNELPELPLPLVTMPKKSAEEKIRTTIDSSIKQMQKSEFEPLIPAPDTIHSIGIKKDQRIRLPLQFESPESQVYESIETAKDFRRIKQGKPVYIRLDKFEETVNSFDSIKQKIYEIEKLLAKTKEIKEKEELELESWEREIQIIKSRIEAIDRDVFDKID